MNDVVRSPLVLYGAGSHAYVLDSILQHAGYSLLAVLTDWNAPLSFDLKVPIITGEAAIENWLNEAKNNSSLSYAISIGNHYGKARVERHRLLKSKGLSPCTLHHPTAFVSADAMIGEASQILAFGHVGVRCRLGEAVIINTRASVDHECVLGNGVHIAPGATLAGRVIVGENTMIGTGASIGPDVSIARDCVIGAGSVVVKDITDSGTYVGVPVRRI